VLDQRITDERAARRFRQMAAIEREIVLKLTDIGSADNASQRTEGRIRRVVENPALGGTRRRSPAVVR
jgi:hypothetical protein